MMNKINYYSRIWENWIDENWENENDWNWMIDWYDKIMI